MIEVELRYKVNDTASTLARLRQLHVEVRDEQHIVDKWFIPSSLHNRKEHDAWFDNDHGVAYRIRRTTLPNGSIRIVLDSKQLTDANNHNTFKEEVLIHDDEPAMLTFLTAQGYYNWLTIDKKRRTFATDQKELAISMDTLEGIKNALGVDTVLEIEYTGAGSRDHALASIHAFASVLGLTSGDLFEKSLTVESMRVLAKFQ
jgi:adenylate cyclase class IV